MRGFDQITAKNNIIILTNAFNLNQKWCSYSVHNNLNLLYTLTNSNSYGTLCTKEQQQVKMSKSAYNEK